ncbi:MAG: restriction endonuclease subunit S [Anaerolineales bacterium]|nr:restriction endonuclease subunit S [Anaerolineales bacterium]
MDAAAGAVGVSDSDGKCTPVYAVCAPRNGANTHYYARLTREMSRSQWIIALARGIRERSTDFRYEIFGAQIVPVPPLDEQAAIVRFLDHLDRRVRRYIHAKRRLIALLNEQKQAIIQQAVTRGLDSNVKLKPSGVEWLGEVPEHWNIWQIGHFARVGNGSTPSRANAAYWTSAGYPWLNSSSVNQGRITSADQFVTDLALRECHLPQVAPGSVLVAITGQGKTRATSAILDFQATINQHIAFITPSNGSISPDFLRLSLAGAYVYLRAISDDSGSTKGALTCENLKHFRVGVPPYAEQTAIVESVQLQTTHLVAAADKIDQQIKAANEYRARIIADVVTGKLDVREAAAMLPGELDEGEAMVSIEEMAEDEEAVEEAGEVEVG